MQPLATIPPVRLGDVNASSELGAKLEASPLLPLPLMGGGTAAGAVLLLLGALVMAGIAAGFYFGADAPTPAFVCAAIALPLLLASIGAFKKRGELRGTLTVYERGFTVEQGGKTTTAAWADVQSVGLKEKEWLLNGNPKGALRELRLVVPGRALVLPHKLETGRDDAFGRCIDAVLQPLATLAQERIKTGGSLTGKGWSATLAGVRTQQGSTYAFSQVSGTGLWEGRARLWIEGKDEPVVDLPAEAPNARLLLIVAGREMPDRTGQAAPTAGFGRRLFAKKTSSTVLGWIGGLCALPMLAGAGLSLNEDDGQVLAVLLGAGSVLLLWLSLRAMKARVFIHERGVKLRGVMGTREVQFSDVSVLTYGATRQYYNGAYTGTTHQLKLTPVGAARKPIVVALTTQGSDEDIDKLRDGVASMVADRLYEELRANGQVAWAGAFLTTEGIRYRPTKFLGGKQPEQLLPYAVAAHAFHDGQLSLFGEDQKKAVTTLQCAGHNFYPGLQLYFRLCEEATRSARGGVVIV